MVSFRLTTLNIPMINLAIFTPFVSATPTPEPTPEPSDADDEAEDEESEL